MLRFEKTVEVDAERALPGRDEPVLGMPFFHRVTADRIDREFPGSQTAYLAAGCFWGVEKLFWGRPGVLSTAVGYMGGFTPNPTYEEVCTGLTGHAETVRVVFDPAVISFAQLVRIFLENHDPTQLNRQGADRGTQYRSAIFFTSDEQEATARSLCESFQVSLAEAGYGRLVTQIVPAGAWYYAEGYHQQYLEANPDGYCPVHATGVSCGTP
ncbi:peptide-methionine (S)-S-oxide reductase MsrA [Propionibacterium australiense]|uniref:Peptide methionine sulfoxide reductase MsrA n=1 Tax=Propionibacterium australiense TaxID=119981 RepID=A0A383S902_9ACTN|nr:peptide-methionine (S)-S-oxide reductase MsrA [Propionibacterium australiense]RLP09554.1 peptide-methionine (S)-S-oxide reductase MsrA [Propionibacterium australiense]RLP09869.1 peptide-methionine (S)-S-oxide reductase MsrA [Propionibacterium australiense]SYZ34201.1 peptide-methionine (S)-S-oxide reductase [Propionibacterium australiense]VEH89461.1 Peptide methionine sulfoxide reductase MsrA [Propionibacterium australiense]